MKINLINKKAFEYVLSYTSPVKRIPVKYLVIYDFDNFLTSNLSLSNIDIQKYDWIEDLNKATKIINYNIIETMLNINWPNNKCIKIIII